MMYNTYVTTYVECIYVLYNIIHKIQYTIHDISCIIHMYIHMSKMKRQTTNSNGALVAFAHAMI